MSEDALPDPFETQHLGADERTADRIDAMRTVRTDPTERPEEQGASDEGND